MDSFRFQDQFFTIMKVFNIFLVLILVLTACRSKEEKTSANQGESDTYAYSSYGEKISPDSALNVEAASELYQNLKAMDTVTSKIRGEVKEVCKIKGCWITLALPNGKEARVSFKDYGFVVPMDIEGREVIVQGLAYSDITSIEEQKHYALDAGKSKEDIDAIDTPSWAYRFNAEGVLIKE